MNKKLNSKINRQLKIIIRYYSPWLFSLKCDYKIPLSIIVPLKKQPNVGGLPDLPMNQSLSG